LKKAAEGICWLADEGSRLAVSAVVMHSTGLLRAIEKQEYDVFASTPALQQRRTVPAPARGVATGAPQGGRAAAVDCLMRGRFGGSCAFWQGDRRSVTGG